ncbi:MAG: hypothetical protein KDC98_20265 [Planctomycetes bacterium]|nr:hypothetical protein [Planctomycetota bacterium]
MFNDEGECGTGAVVPWAGRLWVVTYAPHAPRGSSDRLYEITPGLEQIIRRESIGGTPANRMIHRESQQLFLGPYAIDRDGGVRAIPFAAMFGRPTGNARHLYDPAGKIYYATMEEGLYEVTVDGLGVIELWADEQRPDGRHADLPGYHGKGLYSGQGRIVYANNGEHGERALRDPTTPSGVLAEWDGKAAAWTVVARGQFTEVTGPGGIYGSDDPANDPIWSIGFDHRSLILKVLDGGAWHTFRLPKGSNGYDGAHGWNTEWPRIRDIGEDDLLMTMHGVFWRFPRSFRGGDSAGIAPRSAYLKVIGDFSRWQDRIVLGCDDTAKNEFQNRRRAKGEIAAPRSQSNLWFLEPEELDRLGPVRAVGGFWLHEDVAAGTVSDPFLVAGFARRGLHLAHAGTRPATMIVELDVDGHGQWQRHAEITLPPGGYRWFELEVEACWLRLRAPAAITAAVAAAHFATADARTETPDPRFAGLATSGSRRVLGGLIRARGGDRTTMALASMRALDGVVEDRGGYELDGELVLRPADAALHRHTLEHTRIPGDVLAVDAASVIYIDEEGARWRLPKSISTRAPQSALGGCRVDREVATERDLFHADGTFYELPADNAGGFRKLRPIASHDRLVHDFCSFRGLLVMTGVDADAEAGEHIVRSPDGDAAVWVGAIDDLWRLGKPRGRGGPWCDSAVEAGVASDPYLVTGYDHKELLLSHRSACTVTMTIEADLCGDGRWTVVETIAVPEGEDVRHIFPRAWSVHWLRLRSDTAGTATAQLIYR